MNGSRSGTLWIETEDEYVGLYDDLKRITDISMNIGLYDLKRITDISMNIYKDNEAIGSFSKISKRLYINTEDGLFIGYCKLN